MRKPSSEVVPVPPPRIWGLCVESVERLVRFRVARPNSSMAILEVGSAGRVPRIFNIIDAAALVRIDAQSATETDAVRAASGGEIRFCLRERKRIPMRRGLKIAGKLARAGITTARVFLTRLRKES